MYTTDGDAHSAEQYLEQLTHPDSHAVLQAGTWGYELRYIPPPYDTPRQLLSISASNPPRGSVLLIDVRDPKQAVQSNLAPVVRELGRRFSFPLCLNLPDIDSLASLRLLSRAYPLGIRAISFENQDLGAALWHQLADPMDLGEEWLQWLRRHHLVSRHSGSFICEVARHAWEYNSITSLCGHLGISCRTIRHHFHKDNLPKAERLFDGARLLHAQLALQRDPKLEVYTIARVLGYEDDLSFSNRICRLFGVTATTSRKLLGLKWRFQEWLARSRHTD